MPLSRVPQGPGTFASMLNHIKQKLLTPHEPPTGSCHLSRRSYAAVSDRGGDGLGAPLARTVASDRGRLLKCSTTRGTERRHSRAVSSAGQSVECAPARCSPP